MCIAVADEDIEGDASDDFVEVVVSGDGAYDARDAGVSQHAIPLAGAHVGDLREVLLMHPESVVTAVEAAGEECMAARIELHRQATDLPDGDQIDFGNLDADPPRPR